MKTFCVVGYIIFVAFLVLPGQSQSTDSTPEAGPPPRHRRGRCHGRGRGHGNGQGEGTDFDLKNCVNAAKFNAFASKGENCSDLAVIEATTLPTAASTQPTERHGDEGKGSGRNGQEFDRQKMRAMVCFMDAAKAFDKATNTTDVEALKAGIKEVAASGKGDALAAAYDECNTDNATNLNITASWKVYECFMKKAPGICMPEMRSMRQMGSMHGMRSMHGMGSMGGMDSMGGMGSMPGMRSMRGMGSMGRMDSMGGMGSMHGMRSMRGMRRMPQMGSMREMRPMRGMGSMREMGSMRQMSSMDGMGSMRQMGSMGGMDSMRGMGSMRKMASKRASE